MARATHTVGVQHVRLRDDQRLDDDVRDALPENADVVVMVTQVLVEVAQRPLAARVDRPTLLVRVAVLVHRVVRQVHEQVILRGHEQLVTHVREQWRTTIRFIISDSKFVNVV